MEKIYSVEKDKIMVYDLTQFCIKHILECGQVFRFVRHREKENIDIKYCYTVFSKDKSATIYEYFDRAEIFTTDISYFINYFDLDKDYNKIKSFLIKDNILAQAVSYGYGIRILRQDKLETIISFIISANNNIKRIQKSLFALCENYGENMGNYYAFPTIDKLKDISVSQFRELGVGFRDNYLVSTIKDLSSIDLECLANCDTEKLSSTLKQLKGIGQKVADCIMLFSYYDMNVFPVDTWIKQVYNSFYASEKLDNPKQIRKFFTDKFMNYSGYAQQYLFYYKRELSKQ